MIPSEAAAEAELWREGREGGREGRKEGRREIVCSCKCQAESTSSSCCALQIFLITMTAFSESPRALRFQSLSRPIHGENSEKEILPSPIVPCYLQAI